MCERLKGLFLTAQMSVMTPERPETPRSAALNAEKQENRRSRGAGDKEREYRWKHRQREREKH